MIAWREANAVRKRTKSGSTNLVEIFLSLPWWVGPIYIAAAYCIFAYLGPMLFGLLDSSDASTPAQAIGSNLIQILRPLPAMIAPWAAGLVFVGWLVSLMQKRERREILDKTRDLDNLRALSWQEFELFVGEYFRRRGFAVEERGGASPDGGVDLVLRQAGRTILVQCKHWRVYKVGVRYIRELLGVMSHYGADGGVFVTSGVYTAEARQFASENRIQLLDGDDLIRILRPLQDAEKSARADSADRSNTSGVPPIRPADSVPSCPLCGSPMVLRTARSGPNSGSQFYGCKRYPACRGTRNAAG